jgi:hypothetical protein
MVFNLWCLWDTVFHHDILGAVVCISSLALWKMADNAKKRSDKETYAIVHSWWHISSSAGALLIAL